MDKGTDARRLLLGNVIPLKLGYIGVVNRSQHVRPLFTYLYLSKPVFFFLISLVERYGYVFL